MEAQSLVGAGTLTPTRMPSMTVYHVLQDQQILKILVAELEEAVSDAPCLLQHKRPRAASLSQNCDQRSSTFLI